MKKSKILQGWIWRFLDKISTYQVDGHSNGEVFLYHSGSIVYVQTVSNRGQLDEQQNSILIIPTSSNYTQ
jgi:hypothetical protein